MVGGGGGGEGEREGEGGQDAGDYKTWTLDWATTLPKTGACMLASG